MNSFFPERLYSEPAGAAMSVRNAPAACFTATELIVILVVGVVVASVLLPSIGQLGVRRGQVECTQNLMHVGLATADWVQQHEGKLPGARLADGYWYEQLRSGVSADGPLSGGRLLCPSNSGRAVASADVNYGWNSYLGDIDLHPRPNSVRLGNISRTSDILLAGDGTASSTTAIGPPTVWMQKTWYRESQQAMVPSAVHGDGLNYLFADLHTASVSLQDSRLVGNPALRPKDNYWVERVRPAPGPFFSTRVIAAGKPAAPASEQ